MRLALLVLMGGATTVLADEAPVFNTLDGIRSAAPAPSLKCLKCLEAQLRAQANAKRASTPPAPIPAPPEKQPKSSEQVPPPVPTPAPITDTTPLQVPPSAPAPVLIVPVTFGDESLPTPRDL